ncbi:MAG: c-type cytochrome domain-containing protein [Bacteroidota bacterium]
MDILLQLIGRLHPLIVHLPIGFILLGILLQFYDRKQGEFKRVVSLIYLWGALSATLACITGYLLYSGEGFSFDSVKWHLWSGMATAVFAFLMFDNLREKTLLKALNKIPVLWMSLLFLLLISFTGHLGGNLTHGSEYLVEPLPNSVKSRLGFPVFEKKPIVLNAENWRDTPFYEGVIAPILNNKCVSCHGPKQAKGGLSLHTKEAILKGGENGAVIVTDTPDKSELYARLILPEEDEEHMPPKDKTPMEKAEIELIASWIAQGNPFEGTLGDFGLDRELFLSFFPKKVVLDHPDLEIPKAEKDSITAIEAHNIHVDVLSGDTHFLSVSCINKPNFADADFEILRPISQQIAVLDLGGTQITDAVLDKLAALPNLTVLKLDNTDITGATIAKLTALEHLRDLNLTYTPFQEKYVSLFPEFPNLNKVYLYRTNTTAQGLVPLAEGRITLDYGQYELPPIPSDSIVY